jgi:NADPH-dependent 2,4-dienoyl-CoA reductase/sulfur reductase-like enzyme
MINIAIIGGSAAGVSAAAQARRINPDAKITVFEEGDYISYSACAMPYYISGLIRDWKDIVFRTKESFKRKENIDVLTGCKVTEIRPSQKKIFLSSLKDKKNIEFHYDRLIIATGAKPLPVAEAENIFSLRHLSDGIKIREYLDRENPLKVVIIGGGFIGLQMCEAFSSRFMDVTLIENKNRLVSDFSPLISDKLKKYIENKMVKVYTGTEVKEFDYRDKKCTGLITENNYFFADIVLIATGIKPDIELAVNAGITMGKTGAINVNDSTETNISDVYAAGNCAEIKNLITGRNFWFPLGTASNKQGKTAGNNASGKKDYFSGMIGTRIVKTFDMTVARTGLSSENAVKAGYSILTEYYEGYDRPEYYPGVKIISMELIADKSSGKILGVSMMGESGVDKRIDVFATAITAGMTLRDFASIDLSYSCPFSTVIDITARASYNLLQKMKY